MARWGLTLPYDLTQGLPVPAGDRCCAGPMSPGPASPAVPQAASPILSTSPLCRAMGGSPGGRMSAAASSPGGRLGAAASSPGGMDQRMRLAAYGGNGASGSMMGAAAPSLILGTSPTASSPMATSPVPMSPMRPREPYACSNTLPLPLPVSAGSPMPGLMPTQAGAASPIASPILGTSPPARGRGGKGAHGKGAPLGNDFHMIQVPMPQGACQPAGARVPTLQTIPQDDETEADSVASSSEPGTPTLLTPRCRRADVTPKVSRVKDPDAVSDQDVEDVEEEQGNYAALPEHVLVRNTFIDTPLVRSPSLERLLGEGRRVRSSPPSVMFDVRDAEDPFGVEFSDVDEEVEAELVDFNWPQRGAAAGAAIAAAAAVANSVGNDASARWPEPINKLDATGSAVTTTVGGSGCISEEGKEEREREEPVLGSTDCPSRGSALHHWGACKPCAFVRHGVCRNDVQCEFCHLCEPGEKKRRRKEWLECKRDTRKQTREVGRATAEAQAQMQMQMQQSMNMMLVPPPL